MGRPSNRDKRRDEILTAFARVLAEHGYAGDVTAARCWVGVLAEAVRDPSLFKQVRRLIDTEITALERRGAGALTARDAGAVLAYILGSLVLGAFAPRKVAGFAAPGARKLVRGLRSK